MEAFRSFIHEYHPIPEHDWKIISSSFEEKRIPKNYNLLEEGQICNHIMFLEEGLLRFFILKDGLEINKFFTIAPYLFTSQSSYNNRIPSKEYIQSLEPSTVWQISYHQNQELHKIESWRLFSKKLTQEVQQFTEEILEDIQTETAENRYRKLLEQNPELLNRIPLKHLASFFGIAPQSLSRIRKKIHRERQNLT